MDVKITEKYKNEGANEDVSFMRTVCELGLAKNIIDITVDNERKFTTNSDPDDVYRLRNFIDWDNEIVVQTKFGCSDNTSRRVENEFGQVTSKLFEQRHKAIISPFRCIQQVTCKLDDEDYKRILKYFEREDKDVTRLDYDLENERTIAISSKSGN